MKSVAMASIGVEPICPCGRWILNPLRLPIPPRGPWLVEDSSHEAGPFKGTDSTEGTPGGLCFAEAVLPSSHISYSSSLIRFLK